MADLATLFGLALLFFPPSVLSSSKKNLMGPQTCEKCCFIFSFFKNFFFRKWAGGRKKLSSCDK